MPIVTLLTDFGDTDEYVGVMKGVILSIAPEATIVDLTHKIDPQDVLRAAWLLKSAYPYFPKGTVHTAVVDPGVGSGRKIAAVKMDGHIFLAPDNGLLSPIWRNKKIEECAYVVESRNFLPEVSHTFHGRDIFAPVAARLCRGLSLSRLGPPADPAALQSLNVGYPAVSPDNKISGAIVSVDRFGNLVTNIDTKTFASLRRGHPERTPVAKVGNGSVKGIRNSYCEVLDQEALMIVGSRGFLEIAVNRGSARNLFGARAGDPVTVELSD